MKRWLAWALAGALALTASPALAAQYAVPGLFGLTYDETSLTLDDETYADDCTADRQWLLMLYDKQRIVDVSLLPLPTRTPDLAQATPDEQNAYVTDMLDSYDDSHIQFLGVLPGGNLPFYVFRLEDEEGEYLLAEAVWDGKALDLTAYYRDVRQPADAALTAFFSGLLQGISAD